MGIDGGIPGVAAVQGQFVSAHSLCIPAVKGIAIPDGHRPAEQERIYSGGAGRCHGAAVGVKGNGIRPLGTVDQCIIARAVGGARYLPAHHRGGKLEGCGLDDTCAPGGQIAHQTEIAAHRQRTMDRQHPAVGGSEAHAGLQGQRFPAGYGQVAVHFQKGGRAGACHARTQDHLPYRGPAQGLVDHGGGLGHGQGNGLRGDSGRGPPFSPAAGTVIAVGIRRRRPVADGIGPHRVLGDVVFLGRQLAADLLQPVMNRLLVLLQLLRWVDTRAKDVQAGILVDFLTQGNVLHQLHQYKAIDAADREILADDVALAAAGILGIDLAGDHFAAFNGLGLRLPGHRVRDRDLHSTLQDIQQCGPLVDDLHPAAGPAHADGHSGGTDAEGLVLLQWLADVKEQVAGIQEDVQLFAALADADLGDSVHLDQLGIVQVDPGVAGLPGCQAVAVVQPHFVPGGDAAAPAVGDGNGALRLHQPHHGRLRGLRESCWRTREEHHEGQQQRQ